VLRPHQRAAGFVLADDTEKDAARAECGDVARHVAGAPDGKIIARHRQDRGRRFGRYARYPAVYEVVEHQISDAKHGLLGHELEPIFDFEHDRNPKCRFSLYLRNFENDPLLSIPDQKRRETFFWLCYRRRRY